MEHLYPGLTSTLNYFKDIGISTLLLSPFNPSPMKDNGYDITCYIEIDPLFGSLHDFENFMQEVKKRDMNVIMDFVANHTSNDHPWFKKSIDKKEPFTDFYIWADSKSDPERSPEPPNNWISVFGDSSWSWNDKRKQFYLHQFLPEQPDLNFRNSFLRKQMENVLIFWLEKGVDGFRIDAASHLFEDSRLNDEPVAKQVKAKKNEYGYLNHIYTKGLPETFQLLKDWRVILDDYARKTGKPKIMLTEVSEELEDVMQYYGSVHEKISEIPLNFQLYKVTSESTGTELRNLIDDWLKKMPKGKFPNYVMSSHDFPRVASRLGPTFASSLQMAVMLLPGVPICYYGDELGMQNGIVRPEEMRDSFALRTVPSNSRDPSRTPMLWNNEKHAGFSNCDKTWLPVHTDYLTQNVETQQTNPFSHLQNFKKLVRIRREPAILFGNLTYLLSNAKCFSFSRTIVGATCYLVALNVSNDLVVLNLCPEEPRTARVEITNPSYYSKVYAAYSDASIGRQSSSSYGDSLTVSLQNIRLEPHQGMVMSFQG